MYVLLPEGCPHTTQIHAALVPSAPLAVPGEYVIALENASLGDDLAEPNGGCRGNASIAGRLTVLP